MTRLDNVNCMLLDFYVETINEFIGGETAIEIVNYDIGEKTFEFLYRLATAIQDKKLKDKKLKDKKLKDKKLAETMIDLNNKSCSRRCFMRHVNSECEL